MKACSVYHWCQYGTISDIGALRTIVRPVVIVGLDKTIECMHKETETTFKKYISAEGPWSTVHNIVAPTIVHYVQEELARGDR